jgi:phospholipase/lecithinase/hemolysin
MQPRLPLYYCDATAAAGCHVGMDRTGHYRHQRIEVAAAAWPLSLVLLVTALLLAPSAVTVARAKATALIVFGDSTVDSGNNDFWPTTARANYPPYGRDFPGGKATGRFCDGLMSTDYLSEYLGLRNIVPAYLDPGYTIKDFAIGVNFASAGTGLDDATAAVFVSATRAVAFIFLFLCDCITVHPLTF